MKNYYEIKCSKYIAKLDIREKASLLMVITKIKSGILLMSSIYFRFFQTILPMLTMINEHEDNEKLQNFVRKKFASILRTYIRTNELAKQEQPSVYALLNECYDINLDPDVKQIESHIVVTLGDIDKYLSMLMTDLLDMTQDMEIKKWKDNGRYYKISDTLKKLTTSIFTTYEDISKALFSGEDIINIDGWTTNRNGTASALNTGINSINSLIVAIDFNGSNLHSLYNDICRVQNYIETSTIDIASPMIMEDGDKPIEELYSDFGKMNDEFIKNDAHRNGFNVSFNKPSNSNEKKRSSRIPLFFDFSKRDRDISEEEISEEEDDTQE